MTAPHPPTLRGVGLRCPDAEALAEYLDGVLNAESRAAIDSHLADCAECRAVFAEAFAFSQGEASSAAARRVISPVPAPANPQAQPTRPSRRKRMIAATALFLSAAALVLTTSPPSRWWNEPPFARLNEAFTARRPVELRFPGAAYGPLTVNRGVSTLQQSSDLLDAVARIRRHLEGSAPKARWYHAEGRAALLSWQFEHAARSLQRASDLGEDSAELWIDMASASFERAESNNTPDDYTRAAELLTKVIDRDPQNATALFNRGVVFAKLSLLDAAAADFRAALKIEGDAGWRQELQSRLTNVEIQRARLVGENKIPSEFADEARLEAWLRQPSGENLPRHTDLARRLASTHGDRWLSDALPDLRVIAIQRALPVLAAMGRIRERVTLGEYARLERDIKALAAATLPPAFAVWRDFELLYMASHSARLSDCPDAAAALHVAARRDYRWFETQIALEQSTCALGDKDLDGAQMATDRAMAVALSAGFKIASLRARGFASSHFVNEGRFQESFRLDRAALDEILSAGFPVFRAHQFFNDMMRAAESLERWKVAKAAAEMAAIVAQRSAYDLLEGLALYKAASFAEKRGDKDSAELLAAATARFATIPSSLDVDAYHAFATIGTIAHRGDYAALLGAREDIPARGNVFFEIPLLTALASLSLKRNDAAAAARYALEAAKLGRDVAPPALLRREFREVLDRADVVLALAHLQQGSPIAALTAWEQHLWRTAALLRSAVPVDGARRQTSATVITFANLSGRVGVWLSTGDQVEFLWSSASYEELTRALRQFAVRCQTATWAGDLPSRAKQILVTVAPALNNRAAATYYIRAQGELAWMQLVLTVAAPASTFVVNPLALAAQSDTRDRGGASLLAVPAASLRGNIRLPALPDAEREAWDIAAILGVGKVVTGSEVTVRTLSEATGRDRLVHFAGHAVKTPDGVALVVTPDPASDTADGRAGLWSPTRRTAIQADLIVLSACSTAAVQSVDSTAPSGLAEAVVLAGARAVLATLWDVQSRDSVRFNRAFYTSLARQRSYEEAYHEAQDELRRDAAAAPGSWSAFTLYTRITED